MNTNLYATRFRISLLAAAVERADCQNQIIPNCRNSLKILIADVLQQTLMHSAAAAMKSGALQRADRFYSEAGDLCSRVLAEMDESATWVGELPEDRRALIQTYFEQNNNESAD